MKIKAFLSLHLSLCLFFHPFMLNGTVERAVNPVTPSVGDSQGNFLQDVTTGRQIYTSLLDARFTSPTLFDDNYILAYYGHPNSRIMGIVGRHPRNELGEKLRKTAEKYKAVSDRKGVIPAIYLVYGTCQPGGNINIMKRGQVQSYIDYAYKNGMLVYLDHQIGKYTPEQAINELLPFLKYPNVHLAIDPEWRTARPMKVLGHITADELNNVQRIMKDYIIANNIPGKRQLVFHQFNAKMVSNIKSVRSDYDPVLLVHTTSGWGTPSAKISTHARNAQAANIPIKGFKLWYFYTRRPGVHYDIPLMTPEQVLSLDPEPRLIIYQ